MILFEIIVLALNVENYRRENIFTFMINWSFIIGLYNWAYKLNNVGVWNIRDFRIYFQVTL